MPVMFIHMPRALSFVPLLFGLIISAWWIFGEKKIIKHTPQYIYCIIAISLLCITSVLWSIEPMGAYKQAIKVSAILLFSVPLFNLMRSLNIEIFKPFLWIFPVGVTLAAILASFELAFDMPIYRATHTFPDNYDLSSAVMNRGAISTVFLFFIAILFLNNVSSKKLKHALLVIMTISTATMLALSQCQSGQLAFVLGILSIFIIPHRFKYSYFLIALIIISAIFATPFIVNIMFIGLIDNAQEIPWLKDGYAGPRIEIWNFIMKYALNNPIYGYGIEATRFVTEFEHSYIYHKGATILHPHNFAVQIWMDFGIIGVITTSILIAFTILQISKLSLDDRKIAISLMIAIFAVAATGYGMWQSWWIGELVFLISLCALGAQTGNKNNNCSNN